jgi:hypothetical protein
LLHFLIVSVRQKPSNFVTQPGPKPGPLFGAALKFFLTANAQRLKFPRHPHHHFTPELNLVIRVTDEPSQTTKWYGLEDPPTDRCDVILLMDDGTQIDAEYWPPPPPSLDPDQVAGGFAWDAGSELIDPALPAKWRPAVIDTQISSLD